MEIVSAPIVGSYWVVPGNLRAGEHPGSVKGEEARRKIKWLLSEGISLFIDLTEIGESGVVPYTQYIDEEARNSASVITYNRMSIPDFSTPSPERIIEILDAIDTAIAMGEKIYLHCHGGKGRTGMVVGCYLVRHGMTGEKALEAIQELRREISKSEDHSPETEEQRKMVLEWTAHR